MQQDSPQQQDSMERFAAISGLLAAYATGYDTGDWAAVGACFTDDGVFELVDHAGATIGVHRGRAEIDAFMQESLDGQHDTRRHFSTNLRIVSLDGGSAQVASYLLLGAIERSELRIVQSGRYVDTVVWGPDGARFAHRRLTMDGRF